MPSYASAFGGFGRDVRLYFGVVTLLGMTYETIGPIFGLDSLIGAGLFWAYFRTLRPEYAARHPLGASWAATTEEV